MPIKLGEASRYDANDWDKDARGWMTNVFCRRIGLDQDEHKNGCSSKSGGQVSMLMSSYERLRFEDWARRSRWAREYRP